MIFKRLKADLDAYCARDPAARSRTEVFLCYPGFHAVTLHRIAHALWRWGWHLSARLISHLTRFLTGVEIHPGATIGERCVIDHGAGVVIGETSWIGDDVTLYHGVTLGGIAPSVDSESQVDQKRHPTLLDGVIVGAGANVLGPITIAEGARVGSNAVVTRDIPPGVTAAGIPARVIMPRDKAKAKAREFVAYGTPADQVFDPVLRNIDTLRGQLARLMERVEELEDRLQAQEQPSEDGGGEGSQRQMGSTELPRRKKRGAA